MADLVVLGEAFRKVLIDEPLPLLGRERVDVGRDRLRQIAVIGLQELVAVLAIDRSAEDFGGRPTRRFRSLAVPDEAVQACRRVLNRPPEPRRDQLVEPGNLFGDRLVGWDGAEQPQRGAAMNSATNELVEKNRVVRPGPLGDAWALVVRCFGAKADKLAVPYGHLQAVS